MKDDNRFSIVTILLALGAGAVTGGLLWLVWFIYKLLFDNDD